MNERVVSNGIHDKKMKNIFILGQPRTGKSTIAKKLLSYGAFSILAMDEVRHAFYACGIRDIYAKGNKTEVEDIYCLLYTSSYRRSDTADTAHIQHAGIHLLPDHHRKKEAKRS